jgi:hypothetical protein
VLVKPILSMNSFLVFGNASLEVRVSYNNNYCNGDIRSQHRDYVIRALAIRLLFCFGKISSSFNSTLGKHTPFEFRDSVFSCGGNGTGISFMKVRMP